MNDSFVYIWTDLLTSKRYIGYHKGTPDDGYVCSSKPMLTEYNMRPQDFTREIVAQGSQPEMHTFEQDLIKSTNAHKDPGYYNQSLATGPFYQRGPITPETRSKMSVAKKGKKGYPVSPETRAKISVAKKGTLLTPETRAKISVANKGTLLTPETRAKMSAAKKGKKGYPVSPEHRAKISATKKGTLFTPEHRAKLSAAAKIRYQKYKDITL